MKDKRFKKKVKQEFVINDYIQLKLEGKKTVIYVGGKRFDICKRLIMDIPIVEIPEIDSIDEVADQVEDAFIDERAVRKHKLTPEEEFKAHCSNLHVWAECGFDTRLLHRNLAFPLLKRLAEVGDPLAVLTFKDEIRERMKSLYSPVQEFLVMEGFLHLFSKSERLELMQLILDLDTRSRIAQDLIHSKDYGLAIEVYETILESNPLQKEALTQLGFLLFREGEYTKSLDSYLQALQLHGELYSEDCITIGENYEALGQYDDAKKVYRNLSRYKHSCGRDAALLKLGKIFCLEGRKIRAKRTFWRIIETDFSNESAWDELTSIFVDEEDFDLAIVALKEAYKYNPFSFSYLQRLKEIYKSFHKKWHYLSTIVKLRRDKIKIRRYTEIRVEYVNDRLVFTGKELGRFKVLYSLNIQETERKLFNPVRNFIQRTYRKKEFASTICEFPK